MTLKRLLFRLLGKDPEAVVVSFCSGSPDLARRMVAEIQKLVPDRQHYAVTDVAIEGVACIRPSEWPGPLRRKRIGLAPTLFTGDPAYARQRWQAFRAAPLRLLAYNRALERHHLQLSSFIASWLFLRGVPLDRIWLRPKWFPLRRESSRWPTTHTVIDGRASGEGRRRVAILSPYFPFPLSHGGAVRIYNLIREAAREFDVFLFAFSETPGAAHGTPLCDLCTQMVLFPNPRYREPRWASWLPPEVNEFYTPYVARVLNDFRARLQFGLLQTEYTQMARYGGDLLVEHDVTFDLYAQIAERGGGLSSQWDLWRWRRFETAAVRKFRSVVVMSAKDAGLLPDAPTAVIPNGVDLHRFRPEPEAPGERLLFVGSFAHFPNVVAFRWFLESVWPLISPLRPNMRFTVIAGRNPDLYWTELLQDDRIELHGFISDVRPYYAASHVVVVPTRVSAGTNLKVLEAMAARRAVVSTTSGCAGLDVLDGESAVIADEASDFAAAILRLFEDSDLRSQIAAVGRLHVETRFGWDRIGQLQRALWTELLTPDGISIRPGRSEDLPAIERIQLASHGASQWEPESYFVFSVRVAERDGAVCGFMVSRIVAPDESEILNIAVDPEARQIGVATALLESLAETEVFLEVRESNDAARALYWKLGFRIVGRREDYYDDPAESALVMRRSRALQTR